MRAVKSITRREHRLRCSRICYTLFYCPVCCFAFHSAYSRCRPRLRATEGSFKSGLESGRGGGSPQRRPQSPRQRPKPRCRSEAAFRRLCTPARHTPYRLRLPAGRSPAPSTATQAHRTISYQLSSPLRTACFNSSRSWSSGWARARSKFRISPSRLGAGLGCCFIFSYRSRTAMGILPWHI